MFDLGWTELLVIGIVALIVVGPKDLPMLFRSVGRFVGKARGMAREFSRAMNDAADEAGVSEMSKTLKAATNPVNTAMDGVKTATKSMTEGLDPTKFDPDTETGKLAADRAEQARKLQEEAKQRAEARKEAVAAANAAAEAATSEGGMFAPEPDPVPDTAPEAATPKTPPKAEPVAEATPPASKDPA